MLVFETTYRSRPTWPPSLLWVVAVAICTVLLLFGPSEARAQIDNNGLSADTLDMPVDTLDTSVDTLGTDSLEVTLDDGDNGIDTIVAYSARTIVHDIRHRIVRLYGDAEVINGEQRLTGDYIEINFETSSILARARYDSATGRYTDIPVFRDGDQEVTANEIGYNFKTRSATLAAAETRFEDGFYYGERIKRFADNTLFVEQGQYTTCDVNPSHYHFASPRMKVVPGDKIFADQVTLNVAGVPIFYIPFGVYFANRGGKQSGIILPNLPSLTAARGVAIEGMGYFWAGNEYIDGLLTADFYSKGGYTLRNRWRLRWNQIQLTQSDLNLTLSRVRNDPDEELSEDYIVNYVHSQRLGRRTSISGSLNFSSRNAIRNSTTSSDPIDRLDDFTTQLVTSNISLQTSTPWGLGFTTGYSRTQNIITDELSVGVPVTISLPTWTPFASRGGEPGLLDNLTLGYSGNGEARFLRQDTIPGGGGFYTRDTRIGFTHQPRISYSLGIGNGALNVVPSFSYTESWFPRRVKRQSVGDTVISNFISGFYRAGFYSADLTLSTRIYGLVQPQIFGVNAIRNTMSPTITLSYAPDYGDPKYGYVDEYVDPQTNDVVKYSIFDVDRSVASVPSGGRREVVSLRVSNVVEAKIAQPDTLPDKKVTLLNMSLATSYNAAAPNNIRWSDISASANTDLGVIGNLSGNASFTIYDTDSNGRDIATPRYQNGKSLLRVRNVGLSISTTFSDQGFVTGTTVPESVPPDSNDIQSRRFDVEELPFDQREFFGESVRGESSFRIPWEISLDASYSITPNYRLFDSSGATTRLSLGTRLSVTLTPTTRISAQGVYDLQDGRFQVPSIVVSKDLHCWQLDFTWVPPGSFAGGYYFRLGLKAPQLQDIKLEQRE